MKREQFDGAGGHKPGLCGERTCLHWRGQKIWTQSKNLFELCPKGSRIDFCHCRDWARTRRCKSMS